jgi:putative spermidine/putrescine transport system permease protein
LTFGNDRLRRYLILATIAPLLVSVVVRCYALVILFGPANPINQIAPYGFHMDLLFTAPGVMVGFVYTLAPFMVLSIVASLSNIDQRTIYAARSLGAGTWTVFRRLIVPLSLPGVLSGSLIVFTLVITSLPIPLLLGGARYKMVISLVYQQILLLFNWPYGYAMSLILVALSLLVLTVAVRLIGRVPGMTR